MGETLVAPDPHEPENATIETGKRYGCGSGSRYVTRHVREKCL
jgi:hypothetical protein